MRKSYWIKIDCFWKNHLRKKSEWDIVNICKVTQDKGKANKTLRKGQFRERIPHISKGHEP